MKENLFFLFVTVCILSYYEAISQEVSFVTNKDIFLINEKVSFFNTSQNSKNDSTFIWNFGDDCQNGPVYSRKRCNYIINRKSNEFHVYSKPGIYTISLRQGKSSDFFQKQIKIIEQDNHFAYRISTPENIQNTGFEYCTAMPYDLGQIYFAEGWYSPTNATPDLFHSDFDTATIYDFSLHVPDNFAGNALAADSLRAYAGLISLITMDSSCLFPDTLSECNNYREYIQQRLIKPLERGMKYEVSFYSRLSSHSRFATKIGLCLSATQLTADSTAVIEANPLIYSENIKDTTIWIKSSAIFTANGNEKYITIGNFNDDINSFIIDAYQENRIRSVYGGFKACASYYYIDKVCLKKVSAFGLERSTILSSGKSYQGANFSLEYSTGQRLISTFWDENTSLCLTQGILQPGIVEKEDKNFSTTGDSRNLNVSYYPNPTERYINISIGDQLTSKINIVVYNLMGNKVMNFTKSKETENQLIFHADLYSLESGAYIFRVYCLGKNPEFFKIVKL